MNITENAAVPFPNQDVDITFTSPALVSSFTYGIINVTVCHTLIAEADKVQLHIYIGYYDASGYHIHNVQISGYLDVGSTSTTISVIDVMQLQAGQRLFVRAYLTPSDYSVFWGDTLHPTRVSYEGSGPYVPEFPSLLLLPLVITTTLLAVIVQEIKQRSARANRALMRADWRFSREDAMARAM